MRCTSEMVHSLGNLVPSLINLFFGEGTKLLFLFLFETTGTYPLDSNKYSVSRFDLQLMETYNAWKAAGGTELNWDTLNDNDIDSTTPVNATQPLQSEVTNSPKEISNISSNVTESASLPTTSTPSL